MTLWTGVAVAIVWIYAIALALWPLLMNRSERFTRNATWALILLLPLVGLVIEPWSDDYAARRARVTISIFGGIVGGLASAYWRSSRRRRGFVDYARFLVLGPINPNLLNRPTGFTPHNVSLPTEALRFAVAFVTCVLALFFGREYLSTGDSRPWVANYLIAVVAFSVFAQTLGQALLAVWHVLGYRGRPIGDNIWLSRTPVDFWRR